VTFTSTRGSTPPRARRGGREFLHFTITVDAGGATSEIRASADALELALALTGAG